MNKLLEKAIAEARRLPEEEQEALASLMLDEMHEDEVMLAAIKEALAEDDGEPAMSASECLALMRREKLI